MAVSGGVRKPPAMPSHVALVGIPEFHIQDEPTHVKPRTSMKTHEETIHFMTNSNTRSLL